MSETNERNSSGDAADRLDGGVMWNTGEPPSNVLLLIKCDDYMGDYTMKAVRVDYKKPKPGQSLKGFRKGWRWIKENGDTVSRKEAPSAWAYT